MKKYLLIFSCVLMATAACDFPNPPDPKNPPDGLNISFLTGSEKLVRLVPNRAFRPPGIHGLASHEIRGTLNLSPGQDDAGFEVIHDEFSVMSNHSLQLRRLPSVSIQLVSDGPTVIPVVQTPRRSEHPYWEFMVLPGRQWQDAQNPAWTRVSLPFALKEKNQNCVHNGLLTWAINAEGDVTRTAWQITSETCRYLKVNLWGMLNTSYEPGPVAAEEQVISRQQAVETARLTVKPLESLIDDYPNLPLQGLVPDDTENTSFHGFIMNGVHYRSACQTRLDPYPFCDQLVVPSYSLAKSIFAGISYHLLNQEWPEFEDIKVDELVPECRLPDERWSNVAMSDLVNMTTGNYDELNHGRDEGSAKMGTFFVAESHEEKARFSCETWPRKAAPGSRAVYHTTDTYLLGTAMNHWIKQKLGPEADIYRDFLFPRFLESLKLSPLLDWTQRTYDETAQPFTSHGLVMLSGDIALITQFLHGALNGRRLLHTGNDAVRRITGNDLAYGQGFWGTDISPVLGCEGETWIPFMSGYGGISVALFPNATIYYHFSDANYFSFHDAAKASNMLIKICN